MSRVDAIIKRIGNSSYFTGAEIGVYKGKMSRELLRKMPNLYLYMIDRWQEYNDTEKRENNYSGMSEKRQESFDVAYNKALGVNREYPYRSSIMAQDSISASHRFIDNVLDFVFIDGDHSYNAVLSDINAWLPKIKPGGWICGHDYHREPVMKAVNEIFDCVELDEDNTWFIKVG